MADLMPKTDREVLVTLSDKSTGSPVFPTRKIAMSADGKMRRIGRSSTRYNIDLSAAPSNAWFDNAVMSRDHAELLWDAKTQIVSVQDTGSLHGTTLNGFVLAPWVKKRVQVGDILKFGAPVEKEAKAFHPSEVQISSIDLGPPQLPAKESEPRTYTFTVPDDSEIDDASDEAQDGNVSSDSDDGGVGHSAMLVKQSNIPAVKTPKKNAHPPTIDLTDDIEEPIDMPSSSPPMPDHTPTTKMDDAPTTTFAPALRYYELGYEPGSQESSSPAFGAPPLETKTPPAPAVDRLPSIAGLMSKPPAKGSSTDRDLLGLARPDAFPFSCPSTMTVDTNGKSPTSLDRQSRLLLDRQKIMDRLVTQMGEDRAHVLPLSNCHLPSLSFSKDSTQSEEAPPAQGHLKRKLDDFETSEPEPGAFGYVFAHRTPSRPKRKLDDFEAPVPTANAIKYVFAQPPPRSQAANTAQKSTNPMTTAPVPTSQEPITTNNLPVGEGSGNTTTVGSSHAVTQLEPPRKRIRRVAEAFGYATLGGIAVMSALIATAPDF